MATLKVMNFIVMNLLVTFTGTVSVEHSDQKSDFKSLETRMEDTESRDDFSMKLNYKIGKWGDG